jgi:hypothetical protein
MRNGSSRCNLRDAELDVVINGDAAQIIRGLAADS